MSRLDANAEAVVSRLVKAAPKLDLRLLGTQMLKEFGGYEGLARYTKKAFDACDEGNANQVRILADVIRLLGQTQAIDDGDLGDMSRNDIATYVKDLLKDGG